MNLDAGNMFLPCCERVLQVVSTNLLLLNSEVFMWPLIWSVFGSDLNWSTLFYLSMASEPSLRALQASLGYWPWSWENVKAGHGVRLGGVCMCVHFSLLNPKPNIIDFWNHCPCLFSPSVQIIESWRYFFLIQQLSFTVLQIKNSRPQRLRFACLYPKTVWQATLSTSLGHSEWWLLYISTWWCPHAFESEHFSLFSPCLISWTANRHVM